MFARRERARATQPRPRAGAASAARLGRWRRARQRNLLILWLFRLSDLFLQYARMEDIDREALFLTSLLSQSQGITVAAHKAFLKLAGFAVCNILPFFRGSCTLSRGLPIFFEQFSLAVETWSHVYVPFHLLRGQRQGRIKVNTKQFFLGKKEGVKKIAQLNSIVGIECWRRLAFFQSRSDIIGFRLDMPPWRGARKTAP